MLSRNCMQYNINCDWRAVLNSFCLQTPRCFLCATWTQSPVWKTEGHCKTQMLIAWFWWNQNINISSITYLFITGLPRRLSGKEYACQCRRHGFNCWIRKIPLEKAMATHSSLLAWRILWTEEPGGLRSTGLQRVGHDWAHVCAHARARAHTHTHTHLFIIHLALLFSHTTV